MMDVLTFAVVVLVDHSHFRSFREVDSHSWEVDLDAYLEVAVH